MNQLECLELNTSVPVMILTVMMKKAKYPPDNECVSFVDNLMCT